MSSRIRISSCCFIILIMVLFGRGGGGGILFRARTAAGRSSSSSVVVSAFINSPTSAMTTTRRHRRFLPTTSIRRYLSSTKNNDDDSLPNDSCNTSNHYDVIVVGGGHAGCDAAAASARMGAITALITQRLDTIGELSCNPSIGGIGKGHLVREIDALDGVMGKVADTAGIHYRMLNRRKGPAVRGPRAQMDRNLYKSNMQSIMQSYPNLHLIEASVQDLLLDEYFDTNNDDDDSEVDGDDDGDDNHNFSSQSLLGRKQQQQGEEGDTATATIINNNNSKRRAHVRGVIVEKTNHMMDEADEEDTDATTTTTTTEQITSNAVVITTGTFLRGVLMIGHERYSGGRHLRDSEKVEPPSIGLAKTLERFNFPLGRLKTGTPPRLDGTTINWSILKEQPTETYPDIQPFSHLLQSNEKQPPNIEQGDVIQCYQTATNDYTHELCMKYEDTLPKYDGGLDGSGQGPRYCPSIYKKVQRFPERQSHNCFLEPEGLDTDIVYPNGMSGPYPEEIQLQIMRSMKGLENCTIIRPGYDVEYDFVNPTCLQHTLETKAIQGLYLAGQICGTTGYEEAAAQGIVAGANAATAAGRRRRGVAVVSSEEGGDGEDDSDEVVDPFILGRDEAYIGVLIDDLVTRGTLEPYRMFTSRAEYRISLRADNADLRLTQKGIEYGLVTDIERIEAYEKREKLVEERIELLRNFELKVTEWADRYKRSGINNQDLIGGSQMNRKIGNKKTAEQVLQMPHIKLKDVEQIMVDVCEEKRQQQEQQQRENDDDNFSINGMIEEDTTEPIIPIMTPTPSSVYDTVEASVKYKSYVRRQHKDMDSWRRAQGLRIPPNVVYNRQTLPTLSIEELEKLSAVRPTTFAEASQISGITPQSLVYLYHNVMRRNNSNNKKKQKHKHPKQRNEAQQQQQQQQQQKQEITTTTG